jgi:hypothetical protein
VPGDSRSNWLVSASGAGGCGTVDGAVVSTASMSVGTVSAGVTGDVLVGPATDASTGEVRVGVLVELTFGVRVRTARCQRRTDQGRQHAASPRSSPRHHDPQRQSLAESRQGLVPLTGRVHRTRRLGTRSPSGHTFVHCRARGPRASGARKPAPAVPAVRCAASVPQNVRFSRGQPADGHQPDRAGQHDPRSADRDRGALGRIRTCAHGSGGQCSIP